MKLSEFHIEYRPKMVIKVQALVDFMAKFTHDIALEPKITPPKAETPGKRDQENSLAKWKLFMDGSSNQRGCGAGFVLQTPLIEQIEYAIRIGFKATNNEAEYEALVAGLRVATELGVKSLDAFSNSQLVVNQVQGNYFAKDLWMVAYLDEVKAMSTKIKDFKIHQIPREQNKKADALASLASAFNFISNMSVPLEFLQKPSIETAKFVYQIEVGLTWMDYIITYL